MNRASSGEADRAAGHARTERLGASSITLQKLQIFCRVVEEAGVTRAANKLGIAQPAITAHIRSLEDKLGVTLLRKSGRIVVLTEAGERVYNWASEVIARSFEIERELGGLSDGAAGSAVIATTMAAGTYLVTEMVVTFSRANPEARISLQISNPRVALDAVRNGGCDFAIIILDPSQDVADLTVLPLWVEPLVLCAGPDDKPHGTEVGNAELEKLLWVTPPRGLVTRDLEDEMLRANGISSRNIILELGHPEALKRATKMGIGATFLPESTVREELESGTIRRIATPGLTNFVLPVYLVHRRRKVLSALQRRLFDHIIATRPAEYSAVSGLRRS